MAGPITIYTSLCPGQHEESKQAVASWKQGGFNVVSINSPSEVAALAKHFPKVAFKTTATAPPLLDQLLQHVAPNDVFGLVNGDTLLRTTSDTIRDVVQDRLLFGHRMDVNDYSQTTGTVFPHGFDYFFMHARLLTFLPKSRFQLGRPAWDYWLPYAVGKYIKTFLLMDPIAFHRRHKQRWSGAHYQTFNRELTNLTRVDAKRMLSLLLRNATGITLTALQAYKPKVEIFIVSFYRDLTAIDFCLASIKRYARGFAGVTVAVPTRDAALFTPVCQKHGARMITFVETPQKGMLHHEILVCRADEHCPNADYVLHVDSDCMFTSPVTPQDYLSNGKPVLLIREFEGLRKAGSPAYCWKACVDRALGGSAKYETMCRHPAIHPPWLYKLTRRLVEQHTHKKFDAHVLTGPDRPPQFAEFPTLGAVAAKHTPELYHLILRPDQPEPPAKLKQFWSPALYDRGHKDYQKTIDEMRAVIGDTPLLDSIEE
jgi:hypothetical protein